MSNQSKPMSRKKKFIDELTVINSYIREAMENLLIARQKTILVEECDVEELCRFKRSAYKTLLSSERAREIAKKIAEDNK